jgi:hypothetical protein
MKPAPAPATPEPSSKIDGARSISELVDNLFCAARMHLSRSDFETLSGAMELGLLSLQNTRDVIESMGCDTTSEPPSSLLDCNALRTALFHFAGSVDVALALIQTGDTADYWFRHYDECRALYAKEERS